MKPSKLVSLFFSKGFFAALLLLIFAGLLLYLRLPQHPYDAMLDFVSNLLKEKYGSGGNKIKIDTGFHKLAFLLMALGIMLLAFFNFWKWFIHTASSKIDEPVNEIPNTKFTKSDWIIVCVLSVLAVLLRVFPLSQSLWQDEIGVYNTFIKDGIASTIFPKSSMGSHPLMQIIAGLFTQVAGVTEVTLRLPFFLFGIAGIALLYFFTLNLSQSRIAAGIAAFFLSIHSYHIYYSFQMRGYVMLVFLCMVSCYLLYKLMLKRDKKTALLFIITNIVFVYTHLYSVYLLLAQHFVIVLFQLNSKYIKRESKTYFSREFLADYFHCFLASMGWIIILYLPQIPVIFMNILDTATSSKSLVKYFGEVINSLHFMVAYSTLSLFSSAFLLLVLLIYSIGVKKTKATQFISATALVLLLITALVPSGPGFFPRYLICEIPLLLFLFAVTLTFLWESSKNYLKLLAVLVFAGFIFINVASYGLTYQKIQDYKGAVEFVRNYESTKPKLIVANSLGKSEVKFYDENIIALTNVNELDSLLLLNYDVFAITTYESFAGKSLFKKDKETQIKIESDFTHEKTFAGEFPVNVWHYPKK